MNTSSPLLNYSVAQLKKAIAIREKIESLEMELAQTLGVPPQLTIGAVARRHRRMSAAVRAKISKAAKERWARVRAGRK